MLFGFGGVVGFLFIVFWIWAIFDCIAADSARIRNLPKIAWIVVIVLLSTIGALAWLLLGRPSRVQSEPRAFDYSAPRRPVGPDDVEHPSAVADVSDARSAELDRQIAECERRQREAGDT
jgi:hypothetical protein